MRLREHIRGGFNKTEGDSERNVKGSYAVPFGTKWDGWEVYR